MGCGRSPDYQLSVTTADPSWPACAEAASAAQLPWVDKYWIPGWD